jgi:hypothetical protein
LEECVSKKWTPTHEIGVHAALAAASHPLGMIERDEARAVATRTLIRREALDVVSSAANRSSGGGRRLGDRALSGRTSKFGMDMISMR